jgi:hypothetical protein
LVATLPGGGLGVAGDGGQIILKNGEWMQQALAENGIAARISAAWGASTQANRATGVANSVKRRLSAGAPRRVT